METPFRSVPARIYPDTVEAAKTIAEQAEKGIALAYMYCQRH
jgi:hypothetical protein